MVNCKSCNINIPNGNLYCKDCLEENQKIENGFNEDSLFNTVENSVPDNNNEYNSLEYEDFTVDIKDLEFINSVNPYDDIQDNDLNYEVMELDNMEQDIEISDEDLYGIDYKDKLLNENDNKALKEEPFKMESLDQEAFDEVNVKMEPINEESNNMDQSNIDNIEETALDDDLSNLIDLFQEEQLDSKQIDADSYIENAMEELAATNTDQFDVDKLNSEIEEEGMLTGQDNLNGMDQSSVDDEFLSMINQIGSDDPISDDINAISELLYGNELNNITDNINNTDKIMPSDVGEVFSDALKAVTSLDDEYYDVEGLLNQIPDTLQKTSKKDKKTKKAKQEKELKTDKKLKKANSKQQEKDIASKEKIGLFQRLFANINDEVGQEPSSSKKVNKEVAITIEKDIKNAKKNKKNKVRTDLETDDDDNVNSNKNSKKAKKAAKIEAKKEKALKKEKKQNEIMQVLDDIETDHGRINRLGASIVFSFFAIMVIILLIGTNIFTYTISIKNAEAKFVNKKYTEAYYEVNGIKVNDKDAEIYNKIMTVMYVNKQLNSYNNYDAIGKYPEALDSLLKGLSRYDKYKELAEQYDIIDDMNHVRKQILNELDKEFNLTEKDAYTLIDLKDQTEYSINIYDVVLQNKYLKAN